MFTFVVRFDHMYKVAGKGRVARKVVFALAGNYNITLGCCCRELGGNVCISQDNSKREGDKFITQ